MNIMIKANSTFLNVKFSIVLIRIAHLCPQTELFVTIFFIPIY